MFDEQGGQVPDEIGAWGFPAPDAAAPASDRADGSAAAASDGADASVSAAAASLRLAVAAADLAGAQPGSALAAVLTWLSRDLDTVDDEALVELVAGWRRLAAWAASGAAEAAAALADRPSMNPDWPSVAGSVARRCTAGDELAMRLGISSQAGHRMVRTGRALGGALSPTAERLREGELDEHKATVIAKHLADQPWQVAVQVQAKVLPGAAGRTASQVERDVVRALVEVDPESADALAARATAGRRVDRPRVLPGGMAGMWAVLPAPAAMAVWGRLDRAARAARTEGDPRTLDQLRADAMAALATVTATATATGDATAAAPGDLPPARDSGTAALDAAAPADDPLLAALARPVEATVHVTVPLDALLDRHDPSRNGGREAPAAELRGYGPIAPSTAAALAHGGSWQRIVTDPVNGAVLDVGTTRYQPPAALARHVRLRDHTCRRPGCTSPATTADLDHTVPFDGSPGAPTAPHNMGALCRRDHLLKTHAGFRLVQVAPGSFEWTTPTGHRYAQAPHRLGAPLATDPELATLLDPPDPLPDLPPDTENRPPPF